jgi:hypothetical protein
MDYFKKTNFCDPENLSDIKKIKKTSYSRSSIVFAKTKKNKEIALKMSYVPDTNNFYNNGLIVENQIYKYLIPKMKRYTPFLINSYKTETCKNTKDTKLKKLLKAKKVIPSKNDTSILNLLEKTSGQTLKIFIKKNLKKLNSNRYTETVDQMFGIIFQLFWNLAVFEKFLFRHNDLHFSNIFIETLDKPKIFYFTFKNKIIKLKTKQIVKIFDFDRSSCVGEKKINRNLYIDTHFCFNFGECNFFVDKIKTDLWSVLRILTKIIKKGIIYNVIKKMYNISPDDEIKTNIEAGYSHLLKYDYFPKDNEICSIKECLNIFLKEVDKYESNLKIVKKGINVYKLPQQKKILLQKPKNKKYTKTSIKLKVKKMSKTEIDELFYKNYQDILYNTDILKVWEKECYFYKHHWLRKILKLSFAFYKKTNIDYYKYPIFTLVFTLLACPIYYSLSNKDKKNLYIYILEQNDKYINFIKELEEGINIVWNVFKGKLPIKIKNL